MAQNHPDLATVPGCHVSAAACGMAMLTCGGTVTPKRRSTPVTLAGCNSSAGVLVRTQPTMMAGFRMRARAGVTHFACLQHAAVVAIEDLV